VKITQAEYLILHYNPTECIFIIIQLKQKGILMKKLKRNFLIISVLCYTILISGCSPSSTEDKHSIHFQEIQMECMDKVSNGGILQVIINTKQEYDELIYKRFQKPLEEYWQNWYDIFLQSVKQRYPGLSEEEYERLVRDIFYSNLPFLGTENCTHPDIDFSRYTLLGTNTNASGCEVPDYNISVEKDNNKREYLFRVVIKEKGLCEQAFVKNTWILIPKIESNNNVIFDIKYILNQENN
jgi:hypothetical protein